MPVILTWQQIAVRLAWTVAAGIVIGLNRTEHGRAAGLRTTLLVTLAASLSMIEANALMNTNGKPSNSFVVMDLMRFPLGILSGMGFIGAGTILRKESMILGVTTAATLWFATMMGLCFGGGQIWIGAAALGLGWATLWGLKHLEDLLRRECRATLCLTLPRDGPTEDSIRATVAQAGCAIISWAIEYMDHGNRRSVMAVVEWKALPRDTRPPACVATFAQDPHIEKVLWQPQGVSADSTRPQPQGTPIPISAAE
ncbi:MAG TPA: MgtC/SapB family protein [Tepidisphaeraceae bacterium]|nr:MgtC/SapB family protein [Tepidisphaeraceae bacterium]